MAVKGVFASDQNIVGNRKGDFASALLQIMPTGTAPLFALSSGMESVNAQDTVVTWFEENHLSGRITHSTNASTSTTSITVSDASYVLVGQIYLVEATGEHIFVESVSGTTVTITRGFAGSTAAASDGSSTPKGLQLIGNAKEEGSSRPTAVVNIGSPRFNYVQLFRDAWNVTGTTQAVALYTGDQTAKSKADCASLHAESIERSCWFGRKSIGTLNSAPFRTMDGVLTQITTNVVTEASTTTWDEIDSFLQDVFSRNVKGKPNERIAFCGNTALRVLNNIAREYSMMTITPGITEFGMKVMKWMTPFGDISLMTHPLFNESSNLWTKDLYVLHPGAIRMRYLRRTIDRTYSMDTGTDADFGVLTTELTIEYRAEVTGGKFTNITTAGSRIFLTDEQT